MSDNRKIISNELLLWFLTMCHKCFMYFSIFYHEIYAQIQYLSKNTHVKWFLSTFTCMKTVLFHWISSFVDCIWSVRFLLMHLNVCTTQNDITCFSPAHFAFLLFLWPLRSAFMFVFHFDISITKRAQNYRRAIAIKCTISYTDFLYMQKAKDRCCELNAHQERIKHNEK